MLLVNKYSSGMLVNLQRTMSLNGGIYCISEIHFFNTSCQVSKASDLELFFVDFFSYTKSWDGWPSCRDSLLASFLQSAWILDCPSPAAWFDVAKASSSFVAQRDCFALVTGALPLASACLVAHIFASPWLQLLQWHAGRPPGRVGHPFF